MALTSLILLFPALYRLRTFNFHSVELLNSVKVALYRSSLFINMFDLIDFCSVSLTE